MTVRKLLAAFTFAIAFFGANALRPSRADAAQCYVATGKAANVLCWLDLTSANLSPNTPTTISWTLPDGSVMTGTFTQSGTSTPASSAIPAYSGSSLGNTAYTGVSGKPAVYGPGAAPVITTLGAVTIRDPQGNAAASATIAGADAESLDTGDNGVGFTGYLSWTSTGTPWSLLEVMNSETTLAPTPICTLTGLGSAMATCTPSASGNNAGYVLTSAITPAQNVSLAYRSNSYQGYAYAVNLATLALSKTVIGRSAITDQFKINLTRNAVSVGTATTIGILNGANQAATGTITAIPTETYTMSEVASGTTNLALYSSTYACTNGNAASTTVLPSGSGTTFTITPAADDQIACAFTNAALGSTAVSTAPLGKRVAASNSVVDYFTLTNTSGVAASFGNAGVPTILSGGTAIAATSYTYNNNSYTTYAALLAAVDATPTAANASATIGITYPTPATNGATVTVALASYVTANGGTSATVNAMELDTVGASTLSIVKSGTTQTSPGGLIAYSIVLATTTAANTAQFSDPVPAGLTITGMPACTTATGGAVCVAPTVAGNTVSATIATFPANSSLTYAITASAGTSPSYTNTATLTPYVLGIAGVPVTSSLTTNVTTANGLSKTVQNLTSGTGAALNDTAKPGDHLLYTLSFNNATGAALHNIAFTDPLPNTVTYYTASCGSPPSGISCSFSAPPFGTSGNVVFTYVGSLASGSSLQATITVVVP